MGASKSTTTRDASGKPTFTTYRACESAGGYRSFATLAEAVAHARASQRNARGLRVARIERIATEIVWWDIEPLPEVVR